MRALLMTPKKKGGWQPGANTLVYYNINNNDTTSYIYDLSGHNVTQTWSGGQYTTDATYGKVASFTGSNYTSASSIVNFGSDITRICLFKLNTTSMSILVSEGASSSRRPSVGLEIDREAYNDVLCFFSGSLNGDLRINGTTTITTGVWYMIAATKASDGTTKIYMNGTLLNTKTLSSAPNYSAGDNLMIGKRYGEPNFNGYIKLFIGENRVWTDAEIVSLAQEYGF